jgi:hypothetical protein
MSALCQKRKLAALGNGVPPRRLAEERGADLRRQLLRPEVHLDQSVTVAEARPSGLRKRSRNGGVLAGYWRAACAPIWESRSSRWSLAE